jgi:hypothetical protein
VTYHPEYHAFDSRKAIASLAAAAQLGVGWMRTDVRWREILPDGSRVDPQALAWYRDFLTAASNFGFQSMVVLSTPPDAVLRQTHSEKLVSWCRFVETVSIELGTQCNAFQLMNEPNNPVYKFFPAEDVPGAFVQGASIIRSIKREAQIGINVTMEFFGWRTFLTNVLRLTEAAIDVVGLDHYPGTWTVGRKNRWAEVTQIADDIASAQRGSPWFGRRLAIMETGFSTNAIMRDEKRQSEYFQSVALVAQNLKRKLAGDGILLGIYELCDADSSVWLDPEAHFGLLNSDLSPKKAFATVREIIASI